MCDLVIYQTSGNTYNKCFNPLKVNFALQGNVPNVPTCIMTLYSGTYKASFKRGYKNLPPKNKQTNKRKKKRKFLHSFLIKGVCPYLVSPPPPPPPPLCTGLSYIAHFLFSFLFFSLSFIFLSFFSVLHFCIFPILPFFFLSFLFDRLISISFQNLFVTIIEKQGCSYSGRRRAGPPGTHGAARHSRFPPGTKKKKKKKKLCVSGTMFHNQGSIIAQ